MKKLIIAMVLLVLTVSTSFAQEVNWVIPFTPGGSSSTISAIVIDQMAEKGWEINAKFTGDCVSAKHAVETSDDPTIYHWLNLWQRDSAEVCYWGGIEEDHLTKLAAAESLLCGIKTTEDLFKNNSETLRVGIRANNEFLPAWQDMMQGATSANLRFANYPNGTTMKAGVASGELDYIFSTDGRSLLKNGQVAACEYHSGDYDSADYKHISSVLPGFPAFESALDLYSRNLVDEAKFKADLLEVLQGDEYQETITNIGRYLK